MGAEGGRGLGHLSLILLSVCPPHGATVPSSSLLHTTGLGPRPETTLVPSVLTGSSHQGCYYAKQPDSELLLSDDILINVLHLPLLSYHITHAASAGEQINLWQIRLEAARQF